jgi:hypothetical protein
MNKNWLEWVVFSLSVVLVGLVVGYPAKQKQTQYAVFASLLMMCCYSP